MFLSERFQPRCDQLLSRGCRQSRLALFKTNIQAMT
jgi:hypothetical protein